MWTLLARVMAPKMGCPCCGPQWWRRIVANSYREQGRALPPELRGI